DPHQVAFSRGACRHWPARSLREGGRCAAFFSCSKRTNVAARRRFQAPVPADSNRTIRAQRCPNGERRNRSVAMAPRTSRKARWLIGGVAALVAIVAALTAALALYDWDNARAYIARKVEERTGRELTMGHLRVHPFSLN